jgi:hypothetical protein
VGCGVRTALDAVTRGHSASQVVHEWFMPNVETNCVNTLKRRLGKV